MEAMICRGMEETVFLPPDQTCVLISDMIWGGVLRSPENKFLLFEKERQPAFLSYSSSNLLLRFIAFELFDAHSLCHWSFVILFLIAFKFAQRSCAILPSTNATGKYGRGLTSTA